MSCDCDTHYGQGSIESGDCVKDVVRRIVRAQRRAVEAEEDTCFTSCDRSIEDLLSPFEENRDRLRHNTIPFILYCKGNCKPFIGSGVRRKQRRGQHVFECVESPIFRVKSFVNNDESCARIELLVPDHRRRDGDGSPSSSADGGHHHSPTHRGDQVCDFIPEGMRNFRATGICLTVDLNCFCAISCLDPITPARARDSED